MSSGIRPNDGNPDVDQLVITGVAVEKLDLRKNDMILRDGK